MAVFRQPAQFRNHDTRLLVRALKHGWKIPPAAKAEAIEALRLVLKHGSARDKVHAVIAFAKISEINLSAEQLKNQRELIRLGRIMTGDEPGELPGALPALLPPEAVVSLDKSKDTMPNPPIPDAPAADSPQAGSP